MFLLWYHWPVGMLTVNTLTCCVPVGVPLTWWSWRPAVALFSLRSCASMYSLRSLSARLALGAAFAFGTHWSARSPVSNVPWESWLPPWSLDSVLAGGAWDSRHTGFTPRSSLPWKIEVHWSFLFHDGGIYKLILIRYATYIKDTYQRNKVLKYIHMYLIIIRIICSRNE